MTSTIQGFGASNNPFISMDTGTGGLPMPAYHEGFSQSVANRFVETPKMYQLYAQAARFGEARDIMSDAQTGLIIGEPSAIGPEAGSGYLPLWFMGRDTYYVWFDAYDPGGVEEMFKMASDAMERARLSPDRFYALGIVRKELSEDESEELSRMAEGVTSPFKRVMIVHDSNAASRPDASEFGIVMSLKPFPDRENAAGLEDIFDRSMYYCSFPPAKDINEIKRVFARWSEKAQGKDGVFESVELNEDDKGTFGAVIRPNPGRDLKDILEAFKGLQNDLGRIPCSQKGKLNISLALPVWAHYSSYRRDIEETLGSVAGQRNVKIELELVKDKGLVMTEDGQIPKTGRIFAIGDGRYLIPFGEYSLNNLREAVNIGKNTMRDADIDPAGFQETVIIRKDLTGEEMEELFRERSDENSPVRGLNIKKEMSMSGGDGGPKLFELGIVFSRGPLPEWSDSDFDERSPGAYNIKKKQLDDFSESLDHGCELPVTKDLKETIIIINKWIENVRGGMDFKTIDLTSDEEAGLRLELVPAENVMLSSITGHIDRLGDALRDIPCAQTGRIKVVITVPKWPSYTDYKHELAASIGNAFSIGGIRAGIEIIEDENISVIVEPRPYRHPDGNMAGVYITAPYPLEVVRSENFWNIESDYRSLLAVRESNHDGKKGYVAVYFYDRPFDSGNISEDDAAMEIDRVIKGMTTEWVSIEEKIAELERDPDIATDTAKARKLEDLLRKAARKEMIRSLDATRVELGNKISMHRLIVDKMNIRMEMARENGNTTILRAAEEKKLAAEGAIGYLEAQIRDVERGYRKLTGLDPEAQRHRTELPKVKMIHFIHTGPRVGSNVIKVPHTMMALVPLDMDVSLWDSEDGFKNFNGYGKYQNVRFSTFKDILDAMSEMPANSGVEEPVPATPEEAEELRRKKERGSKAMMLMDYFYAAKVRSLPLWRDVINKGLRIMKDGNENAGTVITAPSKR